MLHPEEPQRNQTRPLTARGSQFNGDDLSAGGGGKKWMQGGYGLTIKAMSVGPNPEDPFWQIWKEDR